MLDGKIRCRGCMQELKTEGEGPVFELLGEFVTRLPAGTEILSCATLRRKLPPRRGR